MSLSTGFLLLQMNNISNIHFLSKFIAQALQKVDKTLYVQVIPNSTSADKLSYYNHIVNQIYLSASSKKDKVDTRVILSDFRDHLLGIKVNNEQDHGIQTSKKIDTVLTIGKDYFTSVLLNKSETICSKSIIVEDDQPESPITDKLINSSKFGAIQNLANEDKIYQHVVLGGTFDRLHTGHKMLLSAAILRCETRLTIGVTEGSMIHTKKLWELIEPCQTRIEKLKEFLMDIEPRLDYNIVPILDPYGPTASDPLLQMIVVSEETLNGGLKVNDLRKENNLSVLDIHPISLVDDIQASNGEENKISSSSLRKRLLGTHLKSPKEKSKPFVIGLTGGIASGKTTICNRLKSYGARVISCDHLGHTAYKKGTKCYHQLVEYFGDQILNADDGEINRKSLGPIVFRNKEHLTKLNSIVWPEIRQLYLKELEEMKKEGFDGVVILDAAILLEAGWDEDCHDVWVSIVPPAEAVQRISKRDGLSTLQAEERITSQLSNKERVSRANVVFCSVWEPEVTAAQVEIAWQFVKSYLAA